MNLRDGHIYQSPDGRRFRAEADARGGWALHSHPSPPWRPCTLDHRAAFAGLNLWVAGGGRLMRLVLLPPPARTGEAGGTLGLPQWEAQDTGWTVDDLKETGE